MLNYRSCRWHRERTGVPHQRHLPRTLPRGCQGFRRGGRRLGGGTAPGSLFRPADSEQRRHGASLGDEGTGGLTAAAAAAAEHGGAVLSSTVNVLFSQKQGPKAPWAWNHGVRSPYLLGYTRCLGSYQDMNKRTYAPMMWVLLVAFVRDKLLVPGRGGGGGQHRRVLAIFGRNILHCVGLLVFLASSGLKVGRSLAKVVGQHRHFQVAFYRSAPRRRCWQRN